MIVPMLLLSSLLNYHEFVVFFSSTPDLGDHACEEGVRCDVEGDAETWQTEGSRGERDGA